MFMKIFLDVHRCHWQWNRYYALSSMIWNIWGGIVLFKTQYLRMDQNSLYGILCGDDETKTFSNYIDKTIEAGKNWTICFYENVSGGFAYFEYWSPVYIVNVKGVYACHVQKIQYCKWVVSIATFLLMDSEDKREVILMMVKLIYLSRII